MYAFLSRRTCTSVNSLGFQWCPRLLATDPTDRVIVMSYCGEPMTPRNQPVDAKQQFSKIVDDMRSIGMRHNDIKNTGTRG